MKWVALPSQGDVPAARSSHSITAISDKLYLWGGEQAPRVPITPPDVYCYDLEERSWRRLEVGGTTRRSMSAFQRQGLPLGGCNIMSQREASCGGIIDC